MIVQILLVIAILIVIALLVYIKMTVTAVWNEKRLMGYDKEMTAEERSHYPADFDFKFPFWKRFKQRFWFGLFGELKFLNWLMGLGVMVIVVVAYVYLHFIIKYW